MFSGEKVQGYCVSRARPVFLLHGEFPRNKWLISAINSCPGGWQRSSCLVKQVMQQELPVMWEEREGRMDWLSVLIPLKLVVICVILVVIYRMVFGWNSQTPLVYKLRSNCNGSWAGTQRAPGVPDGDQSWIMLSTRKFRCLFTLDSDSSIM